VEFNIWLIIISSAIIIPVFFVKISPGRRKSKILRHQIKQIVLYLQKFTQLIKPKNISDLGGKAEKPESRHHLKLICL
jgi:hypothetical protein